MDNKVLDEAVEVALRASDEAAEQQDFSASEDDGLSEAKAVMRAALLAGVKALLGPVIGDMEHHYEYAIRPEFRTVRQWANDLRGIYAPSLGEGDGR